MTVEECKNFNQKIISNSRYQRIEQDTAGDIEQFNASRVREDLTLKPEPSFKAFGPARQLHQRQGLQFTERKSWEDNELENDIRPRLEALLQKNV